MLTFTTDGPCDATCHHVMPAATRVAEARSLVDRGAYFVLRAPIRTGKTTALRALAAEITAEGRYAAILCSAKVAAPARADLVLVQDALLAALRLAAEQDLPEELRPPPFAASSLATRLWESLAAWARVCPRPIVLFLDDFDALHDAALETVLRQLEAGFLRRPAHFPWSVGLASTLDLRVNRSAETNATENVLATGPFEGTWSSRLLPPFSRAEIRALYALHFGDIEKRFTARALDFVHEASAGHPFFVQALGLEMAEMASSVDSFDNFHVRRAYRSLLEKRISPVNGLAALLATPGIRKVIEPLIAGTAGVASARDADVRFVRDLGLLAADEPLRFDGALHRALVLLLLAEPAMRAIVDDPALCFDGDGRLYVETLLQAFASFYEAHAAELVPAMTYPKVAAELVFVGYLCRMLEGRGALEFDYGTVRGRIEITISVPLTVDSSNQTGEPSDVEQREVIVLVARRKGDSGVKSRGFEWLEKALQNAACNSGTLVIFDKKDKRVSGKRIKLRETATAEGKTVRSLRI